MANSAPMKSVGYTRNECYKCAGRRWLTSANLKKKSANTWVSHWLHTWCTLSVPYKAWIGTCYGCHKVAAIHLRVLATLIYKLGIKRV